MKVGLVGCGRIAQIAHLDVLTTMPGVAVVGLAEPDDERRQQAAASTAGDPLC